MNLEKSIVIVLAFGGFIMSNIATVGFSTNLISHDSAMIGVIFAILLIILDIGIIYTHPKSKP